MILMFVFLVFLVSCQLQPSEIKKEIETKGEKIVPNLSPVIGYLHETPFGYGTITGHSSAGTEGVATNMIDGNEASWAGIGVQRNYGGTVIINWYTPVYLREIAYVDYAEIVFRAGISNGNGIEYDVYLIDKNWEQVFLRQGNSSNFDTLDRLIIPIGAEILGINIMLRANFFSDSYFNIQWQFNEIELFGERWIAGPLKINTPSGVQRFAKDNTGTSPFRINTANGVIAVPLVSTDHPHASSVRIQTLGGIKSLGKL
jgi:hypothetical protein